MEVKERNFNLNEFMTEEEEKYRKYRLARDNPDKDYAFFSKYKDSFDIIASRIYKKVPKKSIKLPKETLDELFEIFYYYAYIYKSPWALYEGYNETILPYLDLSEYDFEHGFSGANLKNHSEIVTAAVAKKTGKKQLFYLRRSMKDVILNGVDLSEEKNVIFYDLNNVDFRNTDLKISKIEHESWNYCIYTNFEGLDLRNCFVNIRIRHSNFKNTGAKISFSKGRVPDDLKLPKENRYYYGYNATDFTGCEIIDLTEGNLENMNKMKIMFFSETTIEYDGKLYTGTEEIHQLVDEVRAEVMMGIHNKTKQKTLGTINK